MEIKLNGLEMGDNSHEYIKDKMNFPDHYGANLDALYDCLTSIGIDTNVILYNSEDVDNDIIDTFIDASNENDFLIFKVKY